MAEALHEQDQKEKKNILYIPTSISFYLKLYTGENGFPQDRHIINKFSK